ncbi:MAG: hypothetical protein JWM31_1611 [Solirubrobacterales bacterium]|nr:hypothetical protein [Solirubrobacterales bacterium]
MCAVLAVTLGAHVSPANAADQTVRLRATFEKQPATASFDVPADWTAVPRTGGVTLTAPSSQAGCRHVLSADLDALYVSPTTNAESWVRSRLVGAGPTIAQSPPGELFWAVAARPAAPRSAGTAARLTGKGRYGPIATEVRFTTALSGDCAAGQGLRAAKRLARVLPSLTLTTAR